MLFFFHFQTCLISPICVAKSPNFAFSRLFTDLGRISSARLTFQMETFPACRCHSCFHTLLCSVFVQDFLTKRMWVWFTVFHQPSEWGRDPTEVPAAPGAGGQRNRPRATPGIVPPHCLQSLLSPHSSQCHTRLQHRYRSVTRRLKHVSPWNIIIWMPKNSDSVQWPWSGVCTLNLSLPESRWNHPRCCRTSRRSPCGPARNMSTWIHSVGICPLKFYPPTQPWHPTCPTLCCPIVLISDWQMRCGERDIGFYYPNERC